MLRSESRPSPTNSWSRKLKPWIGKPQQNGWIKSFNGSLRDECLDQEIFDSLADARRKLALWRYGCNNVRPHSLLGNIAPTKARRALEQSAGSAPGTLAQPETDHDQPHGRF
jgi:putative transposase